MLNLTNTFYIHIKLMHCFIMSDVNVKIKEREQDNFTSLYMSTCYINIRMEITEMPFIYCIISKSIINLISYYTAISIHFELSQRFVLHPLEAIIK